VKKKNAILIGSLFLLSQGAAAQRTGFLDHLRIGFGAGANMAHVIELQSYTLYEDLTGNPYESGYSDMIHNIGDQYFVQAEWYRDPLVVSLKPGTYSYRFSQLNEVVFAGETVDQEIPYLLRYLSVPAEVRYNADLNRFRPYAGISIGYNHLLGSHDPANQTFIRSMFSAGLTAGTYIDLRYVILDLNAGYLSGLHNITRKQERFETGSGTTFAQDDLLLNHLQISLSVLFSLQKQKHYSNVECFY
jgi:hypothetical protein